MEEKNILEEIDDFQEIEDVVVIEDEFFDDETTPLTFSPSAGRNPEFYKKLADDKLQRLHREVDLLIEFAHLKLNCQALDPTPVLMVLAEVLEVMQECTEIEELDKKMIMYNPKTYNTFKSICYNFNKAYTDNMIGDFRVLKNEKISPNINFETI